jgi:hypothetical protein
VAFAEDFQELGAAPVNNCGSPILGRSAAMRALLSIVCLVFCGCDFSPPANPFSKEVTDKSGTNRLALIYVSTGPGPGPNSVSFDFQSLVWRTKAGTNWVDRVVISKTDFQASAAHNRWISALESFDPSTGNAIIKVAEGGDTNGSKVVYSWREWSMISNAEVRVLRVCKDPFEPYTGRRIKFFK